MPPVGVGSGQWAKKKFRTPQIFWPFAATDTTASWNNNWKPKKNAEVQVLCYFSPNLAHSIQISQIMDISFPLNLFHSESRLHIGALKTRKSQRHCALGREMSQKGNSTCNITIYGRRWGWGVKFRGQKKLPIPGSKFFPRTPLRLPQASCIHGIPMANRHGISLVVYQGGMDYGWSYNCWCYHWRFHECEDGSTWVRGPLQLHSRSESRAFLLKMFLTPMEMGSINHWRQ